MRYVCFLLIFFVIFGFCSWSASCDRGYHTVWNVSIPRPTSGPTDPLGLPIPNAVHDQGVYVYIDRESVINALNETTGARLWNRTGYDGHLQTVRRLRLVLAVSFTGLQGIDLFSGEVRWSTSHRGHLPALLTENDLYATLQYAPAPFQMLLYQINLQTGAVRWVVNQVENDPIMCTRNQIVAISNSLSRLGTFSVDATTGNITWYNEMFWGRMIGCTMVAGIEYGIVYNTLESAGGRVLAVFNPRTGVVVRNITVPKHFAAQPFITVTLNYVCSASWSPNIVCFDILTGKSWNYNISKQVDTYLMMDREILAVERNYATSGNVTLETFFPLYNYPTWRLETATPYSPSAGGYDHTAMMASKTIVINNDNGFTAVTKQRQYNLSGAGQFMRMSSLLFYFDAHDEISSAVFTSRDYAARIDFDKI